MVPVVSTLLFFMCLCLRHTTAKTEQSKVSMVYQKSIADTDSKHSDRLVQSDISCSRLCLENTRCLVAHYHPGSKRCSLYCSNELVSNSAEEGVILIVESRQKIVDYCGGRCQSGVINFPSIGSLYCENTKHGGGWTVFQRRFDGSVDFYRDWASYKYGFGNMNGEFWLGLEKLHQLTSSGNYMLRLNIEDWENEKRYAVYPSFRVDDESTDYRVNATTSGIGGYYGDAGNSLLNNGYSDTTVSAKFTTFDRDNDIWSFNCAEEFKGAWWHVYCSQSNLNGLYYHGGFYDYSNSYADGMFWHGWSKGGYYSFKATEMMIRRLDY